MYVSLRDLPGAQATPPAPVDAVATAGAAAPRAVESPGRGRRRRVPGVVVTLGLVSLLTDISSESVAAILPIYLTVFLGLSVVAYGVVDALYQGVSALVRIAGGWGADRSGHPKWVAFAGYGVSAAARLGFLVATGATAIAAVIAVDRVGKGLRTAPRDSMIAASARPGHAAYAFGVHRALDTTGAVLGPVLAFAVLWWVPDGYLIVMVASLAFAVLGAALLGLLVEDPTRRPRGAAPADAERSPRPAPVRWRALLDAPMRRLLVVAGLLGLLSVGDGFVYLALLERGGFAAHWFPLMYVGTSLAYLALAVPLGGVADRAGRARTMVLGHTALLAAYLVAASGLGAVTGTLLALALLGTFYAATDGVLAAVAGSLAPASMRASGIGSAQTVVALARMASSAGFGLLWVLLGPRHALLAVAAALALAIPAALLAVGRLDRSPGRSPGRSLGRSLGRAGGTA